jgi:uncharacterized protein (TIGR03084 family)
MVTVPVVSPPDLPSPPAPEREGPPERSATSSVISILGRRIRARPGSMTADGWSRDSRGPTTEASSASSGPKSPDGPDRRCAAPWAWRLHWRDWRGTVTGMVVFDDLVAEQDRLDAILGGLDEADWMAPSAAAGWTVADVVLHLAQTEEAVTASAGGADLAVGSPDGATVDEVMDRLVRAERSASAAVLPRWRTARLAAVAALRNADPDQPLAWAAAPLKPATLATTRLAEHWAHGLDITGPLGLAFPDTARLRHIAWLAQRTLPYAFVLAGERPHDVFCALTAPDGTTIWRYGPPDADSAITGPAGAFCRVAAQRLAPGQSGLVATGPHGVTALGLLRTYAG